MHRIKTRLNGNTVTIDVPTHVLEVKNIRKLTINKTNNYNLSQYVNLESLKIEEFAIIEPREIQFISIKNYAMEFFNYNKLLLEMAQIVYCREWLELDKYYNNNFYYKYSMQNCIYFPKSVNFMMFLKYLMIKKINMPKYIKFEILVMILKQEKHKKGDVKEYYNFNNKDKFNLIIGY